VCCSWRPTLRLT